MSYKTIVVQIDGTPGTEERIATAAAIAVQNDAHLVGLASTGVKRLLMELGQIEELMPNFQPNTAAMGSRAEALLAQFSQRAAALGVSSAEGRLTDDDPGVGLSLHGRYADLVVAGRRLSGAADSAPADNTPDFVALNAPCPVLVLPDQLHTPVLGSPALVAWNGGNEAKRAIDGALPLLRRAPLVHVAVINPAHFPDTLGEAPGTDIALYLARHGISAEVREARSRADTGETLLAMCSELGVGLLAMGCYGHTRLRETLLGGATLSVLQGLRIGALMAH